MDLCKLNKIENSYYCRVSHVTCDNFAKEYETCTQIEMLFKKFVK